MNKTIDKKVVDNIRGLAIDMIDNANSGHPGIALGAAQILYTLYCYHLNIDPNNPKWINRDRFVLSAGHGSALLYAILYMVGYLELDDLKEFRQIDSLTPGHPEIITPGVECNTGPLGAGIATSVGLAIAECYIHSKLDIIDYYTYVLVGDGDLEEGVSYEAMSLAGHLGLNKLIVLYDSNNITLDGSLDDSSSENIKMRVEAMNWNYLNCDDDIYNIDEAIRNAKTSSRPTLIEVKTIIGRYSLNQGSSIVHGKPLTKEDIKQLKNKLELWDIPFTVSSESLNYFRNNLNSRMEEVIINFNNKLNKLDKDRLDFYNLLTSNKALELNITNLYSEDYESTRVSSSKVLNNIANNNPLVIGGSADLRSSTKAYIEGERYFSKDNYSNRNIAYGIREEAMSHITNGLALSNLKPFASTFLVFSDYLKPGLRLSAMMNLDLLYIFTHDSISVGEDGPTHEAVEQLAMLRTIPNLDTYRPYDLNEVIGCYKSIISRTKPSALVCSRNKVALSEDTDINKTLKGAYILKREAKELEATIISAGEEIELALEVYNDLTSKGYGIRLVTMPSVNIFLEQSPSYQKEVLVNKNNFIIEASSSLAWLGFTDSRDKLFTLDSFGASGSKKDVWKKYNFDVKFIVDKMECILNKEKK